MKAGYTPGEIGSLERREETLELLRSGINKDDIEDCLSLVSDDSGSPSQPDPEPDPEPDEPEEDYKQKYEELQAKFQKLKNRQQQDEPKEKSADEILAEIVRDYM